MPSFQRLPGGCGDFWRQAPCCLSKAVSVARHLHGASPAGVSSGKRFQASFLGQTSCFEPEGTHQEVAEKLRVMELGKPRG